MSDKCKTSDCEADTSVSDYDNNKDAGNSCCYALADKKREFLHSDTYMLTYKNIKNSEEVSDRMKIFYSKFFQSYNVVPSEKINGRYKDAGKDDANTKYLNGKYFDIFGIIPLELVPASYIPFNYKNYEMNLDRLSKGDIFTEDDYQRILLDYKKLPDPSSRSYITDKDLKGYLEYCLKDQLNNPKAIFNAYSINNMASLVIVLWVLIIGMLLNILFYYYRDIYSYILLFVAILLILVAVIWKMIYILNVD
jgi:hypothetical protein